MKHACAPEDFENFINQLSTNGFVGGNVTLPHKEVAASLIETLDPVARKLKAVNTVWLEDGKLHGANTDAYGFKANLDAQRPGWDAPERASRGALVIGAGGAARAIIYSLQQSGMSPIWIANRTVAKAENLAAEFGGSCRALPLDALDQSHGAALVVNTSSLGMGDGQSPVDLTPFSAATVVCDIVYVPLITPMLEQAQSLGMDIVDGLGMLLHQAVPGFERWFGIRPEVDHDLRKTVEQDLGLHT